MPIPGHVLGTELSYTVNIYNQFVSYSMLGPAVWTGGGVAVPTSSRTTTSAAAVTTSASQTTTLRTTTTPVVVTTTASRTTTPVVITTTSSRTTTAVVATTTSASAGTPPIAKYGKCGGEGWTGGTNCVGSVCTYSSQFYSQCL